MARRTTPGKNPMRAPESGVTIRMYRQGHGDCFLLCFRRSTDDDTPFFMLIDLGMKGGSEVVPGFDTDAAIDDIASATGGIIDLAVVTHEHEDHVSGFPFGDQPQHPFNQKLNVKELWLAWTEDENNVDANELRDDYGDQLLTLTAAAAEMETLGLASAAHDRVRELLSFEIEGASPDEFLKQTAQRLGMRATSLRGSTAHTRAFAAASRARKPKGFRYKMRLAGLRRHVREENIRFLDPEEGKIWSLPGVTGVKVYPLGPPHDKKLLRSLDPRKKEEFHASGFGASDPGFGIFTAFSGRNRANTASTPFAARHLLNAEKIRNDQRPRTKAEQRLHDHLYNNYFSNAHADSLQKLRQIDGDWLDDAEALALRLNNEVNNTSLVLLFELPGTGKTLLFTGDAQRGNWISWGKLEFGGRSTQDLLAECVFYKAGHHGSHNATLKGTDDDDWPNLEWLARGDQAAEFTCMIPSNKDWAWDTRGKGIVWKHPLPAIEAALTAKSRGRVMVTSDKKLVVPEDWDKPQYGEMNEEHKARTKYRKNYIEHWIPDT